MIMPECTMSKAGLMPKRSWLFFLIIIIDLSQRLFIRDPLETTCLIGDRHAASEVSYRTPMRHMSVSKSSPMLQQLILRKADDYEEVYNVKGWTDALKKLVFSLCYL